MLVYVLMFVCMLLALAAAAAAWISARQPDKPLLGCVSDAVLWPLFALNTYPFCNVSKGLDVHAYLKRAMRQTGLRDVGEDTSFLDRYALVLDPQHARKHGGRWTPSGAIFADVNLTNTFVRKLQLEHFLKKHPEILHVPCEKPVFIIGLPRTGTTLLHRLSSMHPAFRCHYTWEQISPIPTTDSSDVKVLARDRQARHNLGKLMAGAMTQICGQFFQAIHEIGADEPEECTVFLSSDLPWLLFTLPVATFVEEELLKLGAGQAYFTYKKALKVLSWQIGEREHCRRWMLKCPFHPHYITQLGEAFPDATIVWTHRDPADCVVSACSLYEGMLKLFYDHTSLNKSAIGEATLDFSVKQVTQFASQLELTKLTVIHTHYAELIKDPRQEVQRLCEALGQQTCPEFEKNIDDWLAQNEKTRRIMAKGKKQLHRYAPEDYGLTKQQIRQAMQDYTTKFGVQIGGD